MTCKIPGYYKPYKNIGWCTLAEILCFQSIDRDCCTCPIPILLWMEENEVRE